MLVVPWFWRITIFLIVLMLLTPTLFGIHAGLDPETPWFGQVEEVPFWLRFWLMWVLFPAFIASLAFLYNSNGARLAAGGDILSHLPMFVQMFEVTVGVVAILHLIFWGPAFYVLIKERASVVWKSFYGLWVHWMLFVLAISLTFDFRDAVLFVVNS